MRRPLALSLALAVAATTASAGVATAAAPAPFPSAQSSPVAPKPGFRVLPYLQKPTSHSMTLAWVGELDTRGTVTVTGPGIGKRTWRSKPRHLDLMEYSDPELKQKIEGLEQGSWLYSDHNYQHVVTIDGLRPGATYRYTVTQDGVRHSARFTTAPSAKKWNDVRIMAFSDTETEPYGRVEKREWERSAEGYAPGSVERPGADSLWATKHGTAERYGRTELRYPMTQQRALVENLNTIAAQKPDLLLATGDLAQGSGYQPGWDEFWRHFAGEFGDLATRVPVLTALGNWETFAALNGGYGTAEDRTPAVVARNRYHEYMVTGGDEKQPPFKDSYYRTDHGPVTILTLDSTNGLPDEDTRTKSLSGEVFSGDDTNLTAARMSTDTQGEFTDPQYRAAFTKVFDAPGSASDLPNFTKGAEQWQWAEKQLADARAKGRVVIVQFHHAPYSNGVHGTPPNHEHADNQSGVAMRVYTPLFEKYGVATVISGHDEMFERSFVDGDGDGVGVHLYDVGVAADGLRGEQLYKKADGTYAPIRFNSHSKWMAAKDEPELWLKDAEGKPRLVDGGMHYGHLQMDLKRARCGSQLTLTPVYLFPIMNDAYDVVKTERRVYDDVVTLRLDSRGQVVKDLTCSPGKGHKPKHRH